MDVELTALDPRADADEWNRDVERSDVTNPFYRAEALRLQAEDTGSTPLLLAGFKGQEPIGLFPVFEYRKGPITGAVSPAPFSWSCYLGPALLNVAKLKQREADRRTRRFLKGCLASTKQKLSPVYARFVTAKFVTAEFDDSRRAFDGGTAFVRIQSAIRYFDWRASSRQTRLVTSVSSSSFPSA